MNDPLNPSPEPTLPFSVPSAPTSLPASEVGTSPCDWLDGELRRFGQEAAPASPTVPRASKKATRTRATSGPISSVSSPSDALNSSLANRLRARLSTVGSIEYKQTWKESVTPAGRRYWAHTASARTIYVNVSTGALLLDPWSTPCVVEPDTHPDKVWERKQRLTEKTGVYRGKDCGLGSKVQLAAFSTPNWHDGRRPGADLTSTQGANLSRDAVVLVGFNTTRATDGSNGGPNQANGALCADVALAIGAWTTTQAMGNADENLELKEARRQAAKAKWGRIFGKPLAEQVHLAPHGPISDIFYVPTGRRVVLAPEFSLWLMGFPEAWVTAAPGAKDWLEAQAVLALECSRAAETPSSPSLPPSSSAPSENP